MFIDIDSKVSWSLTLDGGAPAPMADFVNKAIDNLDGVEGALEGKGDMPDHRYQTMTFWIHCIKMGDITNIRVW